MNIDVRFEEATHQFTLDQKQWNQSIKQFIQTILKRVHNQLNDEQLAAEVLKYKLYDSNNNVLMMNGKLSESCEDTEETIHLVLYKVITVKIDSEIEPIRSFTLSPQTLNFTLMEFIKYFLNESYNSEKSYYLKTDQGTLLDNNSKVQETLKDSSTYHLHESVVSDEDLRSLIDLYLPTIPLNLVNGMINQISCDFYKICQTYKQCRIAIACSLTKALLPIIGLNAEKQFMDRIVQVSLNTKEPSNQYYGTEWFAEQIKTSLDVFYTGVKCKAEKIPVKQIFLKIVRVSISVISVTALKTLVTAAGLNIIWGGITVLCTAVTSSTLVPVVLAGALFVYITNSFLSDVSKEVTKTIKDVDAIYEKEYAKIADDQIPSLEEIYNKALERLELKQTFTKQQLYDSAHDKLKKCHPKNFIGFDQEYVEKSKVQFINILIAQHIIESYQCDCRLKQQQ